ncbi:hypothetical protein Hanom_Chr16g01417431 [Helianthus anomalus]
MSLCLNDKQCNYYLGIFTYFPLLRAFTSNPSNYTYIPLKNNSYINIFPLKTNTFSLSFQLNNIIITFFSNFHSQPLSKYIKKL